MIWEMILACQGQHTYKIISNKGGIVPPQLP